MTKNQETGGAGSCKAPRELSVHIAKLLSYQHPSDLMAWNFLSPIIGMFPPPNQPKKKNSIKFLEMGWVLRYRMDKFALVTRYQIFWKEFLASGYKTSPAEIRLSGWRLKQKRVDSDGWLLMGVRWILLVLKMPLNLTAIRNQLKIQYLTSKIFKHGPQSFKGGTSPPLSHFQKCSL